MTTEIDALVQKLNTLAAARDELHAEYQRKSAELRDPDPKLTLDQRIDLSDEVLSLNFRWLKIYNEGTFLRDKIRQLSEAHLGVKW